MEIDSGERTWKLMSENAFGKVELADTADLTKRGKGNILASPHFPFKR